MSDSAGRVSSVSVCDSSNTITETDQTATYRCTLVSGHEGAHSEGDGWLWHRLSAPARVPSDKGSYRTPCGNIVADGHHAYNPSCGACIEANSDAPEWTT